MKQYKILYFLTQSLMQDSRNPIDFTFAQRVVLVKIDGPDSAGIRSKNKPFYFTE
jgi:hypothetical protein